MGISFGGHITIPQNAV